MLHNYTQYNIHNYIFMETILLEFIKLLINTVIAFTLFAIF